MDYILYLYTLYKKKINLIHETPFIYSDICCLYFLEIKTIRIRTIFICQIIRHQGISSSFIEYTDIDYTHININTNINTRVKSLYLDLAANIAYVLRPKYSRPTIPGAFNRSNDPDLILLDI